MMEARRIRWAPELVLRPEPARALARVPDGPDGPAPRVEPFPNLHFLSPQERRIVALFALDYTTKEVGRELGICPETVKSYCRRIYAKLGVRTRAGCVAVAYARLTD